MAKQRKFVKIEVSSAVKEDFDLLIEDRGLTQIQAGTRLFQWFMRQEEIIQQGIFQQIPKKLMNDAARKVAVKELIENLFRVNESSEKSGAKSGVSDVVSASLRRHEERRPGQQEDHGNIPDAG